MHRPYLVIGSAVILLILTAVGAYAYTRTHSHDADAVVATASYLCRGGKTIDATYAADHVTLTLSDTRAFVLPQTMSGSGIRYEKDGVAFISKGDNAFLMENDVETFSDCVANGSPSAATAGMKQFSDSAGTFNFMYPDTVTVSGGGVGYTQSWTVNATSSGLLLAKALLSNSLAPKTNFSDATLTVGTSADPSAVASCLTFNPSGGPRQPSATKSINGVTYTVLHSADAAAGNRYDTTSYRTVRNNQCYVIEYTIHSTAIGNYDPSQGITEFDQARVTAIMEAMVNSFRFTDGA